VRLFPDRRFAGGFPTSSSVVVVLTGDLDVDALDVVDVAALGVFDGVVVLAVGWGLALGFAMEADLELMKPVSVG